MTGTPTAASAKATSRTTSRPTTWLSKARAASLTAGQPAPQPTTLQDPAAASEPSSHGVLGLQQQALDRAHELLGFRGREDALAVVVQRALPNRHEEDHVQARGQREHVHRHPQQRPDHTHVLLHGYRPPKKAASRTQALLRTHGQARTRCRRPAAERRWSGPR